MAPQSDVLFGRRLRYLREEAGMMTRKLADLMRAEGCKMHQTTVAKIEAGERIVSVGEGAQFARVLGIDLTQMINGGPLTAQITAQLKVQALERQAEGYARQRDEVQILLNDTLSKARALLDITSPGANTHT